jgi:predicted  nucleic acid-binding Zn-ribbon protein
MKRSTKADFERLTRKIEELEEERREHAEINDRLREERDGLRSDLGALSRQLHEALQSKALLEHHLRCRIALGRVPGEEAGCVHNGRDD